MLQASEKTNLYKTQTRNKVKQTYAIAIGLHVWQNILQIASNLF